MDLRLPEMDGYAVTREILKTRPQTCIVALTADTLLDTKGDCLRAGMRDILTKPARFDDISAMLTKWIA